MAISVKPRRQCAVVEFENPKHAELCLKNSMVSPLTLGDSSVVATVSYWTQKTSKNRHAPSTTIVMAGFLENPDPEEVHSMLLPKSGRGGVVTKLEVSEGEFFFIYSLLFDHFMLMSLFLLCTLFIRTITLVYRRLGPYHLWRPHHRQEDFSRTAIRAQRPRAAAPILESVHQHRKIPSLVFLGFHRGGPFDATSPYWDG
jgi:hypothetical protein